MDLALLEKTFQNLEMHLTQEEATAKARLFLETVDNHGIPLGEDYWLQLSAEWDLNVYRENRGSTRRKMVLYPCRRDSNGFFETDTQESYPLGSLEPYVDRPKLDTFLSYLEAAKTNSMNTQNSPDWFCKAEYEGQRNGIMHIQVRWGVKTARRASTHSAHYQISIDDFNTAPTHAEVYQRLR